MLTQFKRGWKMLVGQSKIYDPSLIEGVSVVIPFRNEADNLPKLLRCLASQKGFDFKLEIILVDDKSTDLSVNIIKEFADLSKLEIQILSNNGAGKKSAIATGVLATSYDIIVQTDADCEFGPLWISELIKGFNKETEMVLGIVQMNPSNSFWSRFACLEYASLQASGAAMVGLGQPIMGSAANMAYRKNFWNQSSKDGSQRDSGDDVFLIQKAQRVKMKVTEPAIVNTKAPVGFFELLNQRARWGAKSTSYKSAIAKGIALLVATYSMAIVFLLVLSFWNSQALLLACFMLIVKAVLDYPLLKSFARQTNRTETLKHYAINATVYPFYISATLLYIMLGKSQWKGRTIK